MDPKGIDRYVKLTRPATARQSWWCTVIYVFVFEAAHALGVFSSGASWELAAMLLTPAGAYMGFRTVDKRNAAATAPASSDPTV